MNSKTSYISMAVKLLALGALTAGSVSADSHGSWTDAVTVSGDLRARHERIDLDGSKNRSRSRIRTRVGVDAELDEELSVHIRLASGSDDPVSTNQTLDGGFSTKDFNLDRAYLDWAPMDCGTHIMAGKMPNPFHTVGDLMFDSDLSPEGAALQNSMDMEDMGAITLTAAGWWAEERAADSDTLVWAAQAALDLEPAEGVGLDTGVGYFFYDNAQGYGTIYDGTDGFGNTVVTAADGSTTYAEDFGVLNAYAKVMFDVGMPMAVYYDYYINTEADISEEDQAFMIGATLGKAKKAGSWQLDYNYREVEADAVIGAWADSDGAGGGTNIDGHRVKGKYQIKNNLQGVVTVFVNNIGIEDGGAGTNYNRVQADLIAKF